MVALFSLSIKAKKPALSQQPDYDRMQDAPILVDKMPTFPGGIKAYGKFLNKNLKWPGDMESTGRVIVSFYIEKDGHLTHFKIVKSMGSDFDAEALRVLKKSPKWIPGMKDGKAVRVKHSVPINFYFSK